MKLKKIFAIFIMLPMSYGLAANLKWDAVTLGRKIINVTVDEQGGIHGILFGKAEPLDGEYYYVKKDYTCAADLKTNFGADCKNTCFPSYKQKGIDFSVNLSANASEVCRKKEPVKTKFQGFKAVRYEVECPVADLEYTIIPEFQKFQNFINEGSNNYFKASVKEFNLPGFVAQVKLKQRSEQEWTNFYEAKEIELHKKASAISLPKDFAQIEAEPFLSDFAKVEKALMKESRTKMDALSGQKDAKLSQSLNQIKKECQARFPAVQEEILLIEVCRTDPAVHARLTQSVGEWFQKVQQEMGQSMAQKFSVQTRDVFEKYCKK